MRSSIVLGASVLVATIGISNAYANTSCMIGESGILDIYCMPFNVSGAAFQALTGSQAIRVNHQNANGIVGTNVINGTTRVVASLDHFAYSNQAFDDIYSALRIDVNFIGSSSSALQCRAVSFTYTGTLLGQSDLVSRPCDSGTHFFVLEMAEEQVEDDNGFVSVYCDLPVNCTITGLNARLINQGA